MADQRETLTGRATEDDIDGAVPDSGSFPVERMRLAMDRDGIVGVEWAGVPQPFAWNIGTWLGYANDPLVVVDATTDRRVASLVHNRIVLGDEPSI